MARWGVRSRHLVLLASLALVGCPGSPFPPVGVCSGAPSSARVDGLDVQTWIEVGSQGGEMLFVRPIWRGHDIPSCVAATVRYEHPDTGAVLDEARYELITERLSIGAQARQPPWTIWSYSFPDAVIVVVESYGLTARTEARSWRWSPDAGRPDAGIDAAQPHDGGPQDGSVDGGE